MRSASNLGLFCAAITGAFVLVAGPARADHGGDRRGETRTRVTCSRGSAMAVQLRAADGRIRIDLELEHLRGHGTWSLVILHERQIIARAGLTATEATRSLQLTRNVSDWYGTDTVVSRASGPGGEQCRATAAV